MSNTPKKKGSGVGKWSVLTVLTAVLLAAAIFASNLAMSSAQAINIALKTPTNQTRNRDDSVVYFESDYASREELEAAGKAVSEQVAGEGAVLLLNNGALPLAAESEISALSHSSIDLVTCGVGAADIDTSAAPTLKEALEAEGLVVNPTLWDFYATGAGSTYIRTPGKLANQTSGGTRNSYTIAEVPVDVYTDDVKASFAEYNDAAVIVLSRIAGEGADLALDGFTDGTNILELTEEEKAMFEMANENFETVIVLINSTNALDCSFLYDYDVDAALWIGYTGEWGLNAVADILVGNVSPSGKLVDTYTFDNTTAPSVVHIYGADYSNVNLEDTATWYDVAGGQLDGNTHYNLYQEGIYMGYRYYETRYEDVVMGTGNAGDYDYAATVAFPFGYGLSYTSFDWSDFAISYDAAADAFTASVTVTNTGDVAGKEVVEIYFQSPYTQYDKDNGIEKSAVELCGFGKTAILDPGASENVQIIIPREQLRTYDAKNAKTYIVDAGDYYFTAGRDAHDAVNNVLAAKGYTTANGMTAEGNAAMAYKHVEETLDSQSYANSSATGNPITNQFDNADLGYYGVEMDYLSRSDWQGTWPQTMDLEASEQMITDGLMIYQKYTGIEGSTTEYPTMGADNGMTLGIMIGKDFDDPDWELLLDQATFEEMAVLISQGYHNTAMMVSVSKPSTLDDNGPQGFNQNLTGVAECITAYPDENTMGATWNTELMYEMGRCLGNDCLELGASGLYAPNMNLHRNAFSGRNFEYYSEDPFLSGKIAAAEVQGIQAKGVYCYIKHFALNDSETECRCVSSWANEQTIRELYLEPFEMAIVEGGAMNVMNAFSRFGVVWSGAHEGLMTNVLRGEWGMKGFGLTDFSGNAIFASYGIMMKSFDVAYGLLAGTDSWDSSAVQWTDDLNNLYKDDPDVAQAMREATHRILYTVANSNAMNGFTAETEIVEVTPWWQTALVVLQVVVAVLFLACVFKLVKVIGKDKKAKAAQAQN